MYRVYQVKNGDTISKIAESLNISSQELINLNSLNNEVTPGQLIVVPNQNTIFESYTVVKGDNLYDIARRYNISVEDLISLNGIDSDDYIYPGESILVPKNDIDVYITKESETITDLSNKLGVGLMDIVSQNEKIYLLPEQLIIYRKWVINLINNFFCRLMLKALF